jgi:hypothetical protein
MEIEGTDYVANCLLEVVISLETKMRKLSLLAISAGAAAVCAAAPVSLNLSPAAVSLLAPNQAEARTTVVRPVAVRRGVRVARAYRRPYRAVAAAPVVAADDYGPAPAPAAYYEDEPAVVAPAPAVVAPAPAAVYVAPAYGYSDAEPYVVVDPVTGRWCRIEASGYRWCWTP